MSIPATQQFCRQLAHELPDVEALLVEHIADYDEILPHVFMADLTRYMLAEGAQRRGLVSRLEHGIKTTDDEDIQNVICVSFLEHLDDRELEQALDGVAAPGLREEWRQQRL